MELYTDIEYLKLLGERIRDQRLSLNISQQEVADFCGISRRTIILLEQGKGTHLLNFVRVLRKLNVDINLLDLIPEVNHIDPFEIPTNKKRERAS
jgi:putative transcriptional regulator